MYFPKEEVIEQLRKEFPRGSRVMLDRMEDVQAPPVGTMGTVRGVDSTGSILVSWDNGSGLNVVYGEDACHVVDSEWILTDPDSFQMRKKVDKSGEIYELYQINDFPEDIKGRMRFEVIHDFIDINTYDEEDIADVLNTYDGLLEDVDDTDERNALVCEAIFELNAFECQPVGAFASWVDAMNYIREITKYKEEIS